MAGVPQPFFNWDDDIPDFFAKFRLYLQNQNVDLADNARALIIEKDQAIEYLRGFKLRTVEDLWNEDWHIADGHPTNASVNIPNANTSNMVVVPGIHFGQAIWWLKTHFPIKLNIRKCDICEETGHTTLTYNSSDLDDEENDGNSYDEDNNIWTRYDPPVKKNSHAKNVPIPYSLEKESKSDKWFLSLQYLNAKIDDLTISNSFLDDESEFGTLNDTTINALKWKVNKPSDFAIKGNSKHITETLE
ncbi:hypothetical protein RclHR1_05970005 [Rhizophagus clarus]|uniref:Uncharacterized protein n=1 Tax=Rhizophagus clarus TaxID=94130 RepID=A0A2Z6RPI0_9GLOM|nr:hypothetical protein RclHR1_05970005 [Rhizophagus clarus]